MKAILVTGADGQLGTELRRSSWPAGWRVVATDRAVLDLTDTAAIGAFVAAGHDGRPFAAVINGAACHSLHHSRFEFNYGQYTTLWDRIGGTYLKPAEEMFEKSFLKKKWI